MATPEKKDVPATTSPARAERWTGDWPFPRWFPDLWSTFTEHAPMRVEEFTEGDTLVVRAEMPGLDPEQDVELTVADQMLRIRAHRREESRTEEKGGYRSEFRYGSLTRTVALPAGASEDDVKATYADGILEVRIPVDRHRAESHKIPVTRG